MKSVRNDKRESEDGTFRHAAPSWFRAYCFLGVILSVVASGIPADAAGLTNTGNRLINQNTAGISDTSEPDDQFGRAVASGDFNGDGYVDAAVGVPYETLGTDTNAGLVHILYGTATGLSSSGSQTWDQDPLPGSDNESGDRFGFCLVAGNFNGDAYDDLAIGSPYEDWSGADAVGIAFAMYGSASGLKTNGAQFFIQGSGGVEDSAEEDDAFGYTLAAGDFNGDGCDELVVGVPYEDVDGVANAGLVHVFPGSAVGLDKANDTLWHQNTGGIPGSNTANDNFAWSLSSGNYNGDTYADLAVGMPYKDISNTTNCGAVAIIKGSSGGLTPTGSLQIHQDTPEVEGIIEKNDYFGYSLASGNIDHDGYGDLVVGIPYEESSITNSGYLAVLYGSTNGPTGANDELISQGTAGILDTEEVNDYFAWQVATGDFNGDGFDDVVASVPYEDFGAVTNAGAVNVMYGSAGGLSTTGDQFWNQDSDGINGIAANSELFGYSLTAGDYNGDGAEDLIVGVPWDIVGATDDGSVNLIYGSLATATRWHNGATSLGGGWYRYAWFGDFAILTGDWIYHNFHGYMYSASTVPNSIFFYTMDMGWLWTGDATYSSLYRFADNKWLWYQVGTMSPRWFYNLTDNGWESH